MRIESFYIQGFKSLTDVKIEGLADINVFYGLNNVGKSNIFQALNLLLKTSTEQVEEENDTAIFQLGGGNLIQGKIQIHLGHLDLPEQNDLMNWITGLEDAKVRSKDLAFEIDSLNDLQIISTIALGQLSDGEIEIERDTRFITDKIENSISNSSFLTIPTLHTIQASRRIQTERKGQDKHPVSVSDHNLKQALFYAYLSRDLQQKRRLSAIKHILAEPPFSLGELDIALDPATDQIDIGFVQANGRLPLENMGSGVQQLILLLGQIFLNDYPLIAIEEPEMNLSPQYQQYLLVALRQLMQDPDIKLQQLFISTHSPYFEFEETFFDVTMDQAGLTHVARLPLENRAHYFPSTQVGPETGARLNSLNQVQLYNGVIDDLGLERGDLILFTKNEAKHWEIRPENDIVQELETITQEDQ